MGFYKYLFTYLIISVKIMVELTTFNFMWTSNTHETSLHFFKKVFVACVLHLFCTTHISIIYFHYNYIEHK